MGPLHSPKEYLFNLHTTSSSEAKRLWKQQIKEKWNNECAYCGSSEKITIDHIIPHIKGGTNSIDNLISCCEKCNRDKSHLDWKEWYLKKEFFTQKRMNAILESISEVKSEKLYRYKQRRNNAS